MTSINIEFAIQDNQTGVIYDASEIIGNITWSGQITGQPGKLTYDIVRDGSVSFYEGSPCSLIVDGYKLFYGWVFNKSRSNREITSVTAYDAVRYLKNSDVRVFPAGTSSTRFTQLCKETELPFRVVHPSSYVLPVKAFDNKTYYDMLDDGITNTLIHTGQWFVIRDNFGVIEFLDIAKLKTNLVIGDASLMTGYNYTTSIDEGTANRIKLTRPNPNTGKRDVYMVLDSSTIARWGLLQHYESLDDNLNEAQIRQRAEQLLKIKNRVTRKLSLNCIGDFRVMPGNSIWVETQLEDMHLSRYMLVHGVTHTIKNKMHTMKVSLEVAE